MSNSLLYLAIVAVWGVVLVPMLLRRDAAAGGRRLRLTRRPGELGAHDVDDRADERADDFEDADEHGHDGEPADDLGSVPGSAQDDHEIAPGRGGYADVSRYGPGRAGAEAYPEAGGPPGGDARQEAPAPRPVRPGRAAIIARRRRRTTGLTGLLLATVVAVSAGLGAWWTIVPPLLLLAGHLTLLRAAVRMDTERRRALARRRREAERRDADRLDTGRSDTARSDAGRSDTGRTVPEPSARPGEDPDSADIIDITAARQEPYDQYADAHLRAVGD